MKTVKCCVTGAKKLTSGKPCEDFVKVVRLKEAVIAAVADGHGDPACRYASDGSRIAAETACRVIRGFIRNGKETGSLVSFLNDNRDNIAREISKAFITDVINNYLSEKNGRTDEEEIRRMLSFTEKMYEVSAERLTADEMRKKAAEKYSTSAHIRKITYLYGTTLRVCAVSGNFVFSMALGDGDTVAVTDIGAEWILPKGERFSVATDSMCGKPEELANNFYASTFIIGDGNEALSVSFPIKMVMLATDGFSNSFPSDERFCKKICDIYDSTDKHGTKYISRKLPEFLSELSRNSVYRDDIGIVMIFPDK